MIADRDICFRKGVDAILSQTMIYVGFLFYLMERGGWEGVEVHRVGKRVRAGRRSRDHTHKK